MFKSGAILGVDQFLENDRWDMDIICEDDGSIIGKIDYDTFVELKETQAASAIKFYNRLMRHKSYELIYEKKNNEEYFVDRMEKEMARMALSDGDLLCDLRLGSEKSIQNLFEANQANKLVSHQVRHGEKAAERYAQA